MRIQPLVLPFIMAITLSLGCQEDSNPPTVKIPPQAAREASGPPAGTMQALPAASEGAKIAAEQAQPATEERPGPTSENPPSPPLFEDFQGAPQLSLFPRVGDFRPAQDSERLPYWSTFIDHLVRTTGVAEDQATGNRAWAFRSIDSITSLGYFSPLAVDPLSRYKVSFTLSAELAEGATAGVGILEFDEFLWIPEQYTEEIYQQHFRGSKEGQRLQGTVSGSHSFTFTTGQATRMIHLVLFRDGTHDRNSVLFDDIKIVKAEN